MVQSKTIVKTQLQCTGTVEGKLMGLQNITIGGEIATFIL